jgi:hypothetical protein
MGVEAMPKSSEGVNPATTMTQSTPEPPHRSIPPPPVVTVVLHDDLTGRRRSANREAPEVGAVLVEQPLQQLHHGGVERAGRRGGEQSGGALVRGRDDLADPRERWEEAICRRR